MPCPCNKTPPPTHPGNNVGILIHNQTDYDLTLTPKTGTAYTIFAKTDKSWKMGNTFFYTVMFSDPKTKKPITNPGSLTFDNSSGLIIDQGESSNLFPSIHIICESGDCVINPPISDPPLPCSFCKNTPSIEIFYIGAPSK